MFALINRTMIAAPLLACVALTFGCDRTDHQDQSVDVSHMRHVTPPAMDREQIHADDQSVQQAMKSDVAATESSTASARISASPAIQEARAEAAKIAVAKVTPAKSATTRPVNNDVTGTVTFTQLGDKVVVVADISGLEPNTKHGFHIHDKSDLSAPDLMSTGGHWNPDHHIHGGPTTSSVHAGDMGNLEADANGKAHLELTLSGISVGGPKNNVVGHSVIIHAGSDDLSSQPAGNSGPRVAGGVIEMQEEKGM